MGAAGAGILLLAALLCGCGRCGDDLPAQLRVGGRTPYMRCLAAAAPQPRQWRVGAVSIRVQGRALTIDGLQSPTRIAAFSGPAFSQNDLGPALERLVEVKPQLALMVGGVGDIRETAVRTLGRFGQMRFPTLVLAGGRDSWANIREAMDRLPQRARDRIIDITALYAVSIGSDTFVPVAGAAHGKYALSDEACGYGEEDLDRIERVIGRSDKGSRWLVSWQLPGGGGLHAVGRTSSGLDVGDKALAGFAERVGARGGVFAWPRVQVMRARARGGDARLPFGVASEDTQIVVPRLVGPAMERDDGSRVTPGFALLHLSAAGLAVGKPQDPSSGRVDD